MRSRKTEPIELTVFMSGNSTALRLPKSLGFEAGERVLAYNDGAALVLKPVDSMGWPVGYFDSWDASSLELPDRSSEGNRERRIEAMFGKGGLG